MISIVASAGLTACDETASSEAQMKAFAVQVNTAILTKDTDFILQHRDPVKLKFLNEQSLRYLFSSLDPRLVPENSKSKMLSMVAGPDSGVYKAEFITPDPAGVATALISVTDPHDGNCCMINGFRFAYKKN